MTAPAEALLEDWNVTLARGSRGPAVDALQQALRAIAGQPTGEDAGRFDAPTDQAVRAYQRSAALEPDGVVGPLTRAAIRADLTARSSAGFENFRGTLGALLSPGFEFHPKDDAPHQPTLASGVTLPPGYDLRYQRSVPMLRELYGPLCTPEQLVELERVRGLRGMDARSALRNPVLASVRVTRDQAAARLPRIAEPFWLLAQGYVPALMDARCPTGAHTALLSLAYNAGPDALSRLRTPAARGAWHEVAAEIERMHASSPALSARRHTEARLLRDSLQ